MPRLTPTDRDREFIKRVLIVLVALMIVTFLYKASDLLLLVFGGFLAGLLLSTVADTLAARTPLNRTGGLIAASLLLFGVLGTILWLFGAETSRQVSRLGQTLPGDWARLKADIDAHPIGHMLVHSIDTGSQGSRVAAYALGASWGAVEVVVNFIIILIGGLFFAAEPGLYRRGLVRLAPPAHRPVVDAVAHDVATALRLWLLTQLISMLLMGIMIGLGLWWAGLESPVALGLLGGLSEFIPYVGPTLAMIPAIIVALAGHGSVWGTLATYAIVRIVQANVITPLISQRVISVPPGLYLFLILASGYAFGTFGLFFAGALAVAAYTAVIRLYSIETLGDEVDLPGQHNASR